MKVTLYVLELEHQKWYVGVSCNMEKRMKAHWNGNGTAWTDQHKPIRVFSETVYPDRDSAEQAENELTLKMHNEGYDVRGGLWCHPVYPPNKLYPYAPFKWCNKSRRRKNNMTLNDIMY